MSAWLWPVLGIGTVGTIASTVYLRKKGLHRWLWPYCLTARKRKAPSADKPIHVLISVCDHYEPKLGGAPPKQAQERVQRWVEDYPKLFERFQDSDGQPPKHSFFYPVEEYEPHYLDSLAGLCRKGLGEVEIHLHHDNDTAENLRQTLIDFKQTLHGRHGLLSKDPHSGEIVYGFIHGNWALDNARCDGRWCGVNNELDVLRETGCYADFTLPSAPSETQTRKINAIYWAVDDPHKPKSHDSGWDVGTIPQPERSLLLIQGPLMLDWRHRKWGLMPRIENACLQGSQAPSMDRLDLWLRACVQVAKRPDWYFVKLHTHGANEFNMPVLLGEPMVRFHEGLKKRSQENPNFQYHYVTAREMYNLVRAAENGWNGTVNDARNYCLAPS